MTGVAAIVVLLFMAADAGAQPMTRCAACHFANMSMVPAPERLGEWQRSAHARQAVGCDKCHGGDPWTYQPTDAHRGVLSPANPLSPVRGSNLPQTCGQCHQRNAEAFETSLHHILVEADERRAPTCATCHGAMRAQVPSPAALEARCAECHPAGSSRGQYPALMRESIEALNALRARADELDDVVAQVPEHARRVELLVALYDARTTLKESMARVHGFDVQRLNERVAAARRELEAVARASAKATASGR